ncbi:MAG TPA: MarR family winged helix-turn-helix transcriptional regulator [Pirellulales bacterium]|jgi:DNA-binding MarR family transcriptional regulator
MAKQPAISQLQDHLGYWLRFVSNHVSHAFTRKVEAQGVTVAEWVVMREMLELDAAHPSQLAERLGMTRGAISKLVERLCGKQLAERRSVEGDRRYQTVELTAAGRKLVPRLARLADENDREFFGDLDPKSRAALAALLREMAQRHGWKDVPLS